MSQVPLNLKDVKGAVYVVTHAAEYTLEQWRAAAVSCLTGEHGPEARALVHVLAERCGIDMPPGYLEEP